MPRTVLAKRSTPAAPQAKEERARGSLLSAGELRESIIEAWERVHETVRSQNKDALRKLHITAKRHDLGVDRKSLIRDFAKFNSFFPEATGIDPAKISPELVPVGDHRSLEGKLFRLCRASWSMPFSKGYGRRLRFLVFDRHHEAVIGILGLQSPPADLACRDKYFGATKQNKLAVANTTMDAYTVGASPTYAPLLGGKLVAGFIHSNKVRQAYWSTYGGAKTVMLGERLPQPLLAVTTTSAFGRSSIYNRLRLNSDCLARPLGYTRGFGTIHLEEVYPHVVAWLKDQGNHVPAGFGNGPKVRWQNIIRALGELGIPRSYLGHGIEREVFIFEFASNLPAVHQQGAIPIMRNFDDEEWANYWKERWCTGRAARNKDWASFSVHDRMTAALAAFS